jgi:hypothetical protein
MIIDYRSKPSIFFKGNWSYPYFTGHVFPKQDSMDSAIRSRTISPEMPPVVATWLITSLSQKSILKASRIRSSFHPAGNNPQHGQLDLVLHPLHHPATVRLQH